MGGGHATPPAALLALGVAPGDRVGVWSPNRYEWVVVQYATARVGAILVNINPAYQAAELEYALRQSGVSVLFHARGFRQLVYGPMLDAARPRCPALQRVVRFDEDWPAFLASGEGVAAAELERREAALQFDDPINIQYTSGTTGFPKGATLTHHNILNNGFFVGEAPRPDRARPRLHPGAVLSLFRHGLRLSGLHQPRRLHGVPGGVLRRPRPCCGPSRPNAAPRCTACRPCSAPCSKIRPSTTPIARSLRTGIMAGVALSHRTDDAK